MKRFFTIAVVMITLSSAWGQEKVELSGTISTTNLGGIPRATIRVLNTNLGAVTDESGAFTIYELAKAKYTLEISAIGYASVKREVDLNAQSEPLEVQLVESARQLNAVIVTAEKKEDDIQKIPSSISNISSVQVQQYRLWNAKDITAIAPNLYSANPGDNRNVTSIRGVTTTSYDPAVATYVDGVNQFNLDTYISPIFDVERIEVLRGPQGTLYGRNAMGGVINIITKEPTNSTHGFAEINSGNYGQQRYTFGIRTPLISNKLFLGVAGMYDKNDGFYFNTYANENFDRKSSYLGNYYLKYLINSRLSVTLNVKHNNNRNHGAFALALNDSIALANPFVVEQNALTKLVDNVFNTSLNIHHNGRVANFTSLTTYQSNYRYYTNPIDGDFSPYNALTIVNNYGNDWNNVNAWTQEFKFTSAPSLSPLNWTAGSYLFYQDSPNKQATHFGPDIQPDMGFPNTYILNTTEASGHGIALFGQATYVVNSRFDLTLGARFDYERKKQRGLSELFFDGVDEPVMVLVPDSTAEASFNAFSPKAGLTYNLSDDQHLYGTYSRGFRAGGFTQVSADPSQSSLYKYKPEHSNNFEVGMKNSLLHNRVRLNVAAFYIIVNDSQVPTLILPQALTATQNAGKLISKGVELEFSATPSKGLEIIYNFGYTEAKFDNLNVPNSATPDDPNDEISWKGNRQLFTPEVTSMLAVQYGYHVSEWQSLRLVARMEAAYIGQQYFDLANTIKQESYGLYNARAGVAGTHFELMFWMRNITDKKYISYAYDFGGTHLGDPRNFGVTLRGMF